MLTFCGLLLAFMGTMLLTAIMGTAIWLLFRLCRGDFKDVDW